MFSRHPDLTVLLLAFGAYAMLLIFILVILSINDHDDDF